MKQLLLGLGCWFCLVNCLAAAEPQGGYALREGDIVFSGSPVGQGEAIMAATGSRFTHCGIVFMREGRAMVLEAVQPVRVTTVAAFMQTRRPAVVAVRRLKVPLTPEAGAKAKVWAAAQVGRDYDARFEWGDEKLYCSELVWKAFEKAGVRLCEPRRVRDYNLQHPKVREIIRARFGEDGNLRLDERVVAPSDLADSPLLEVVPREKG